MTAKERQELTRRPLTWTVQAPHWPWSQPFLVPGRSRFSRRAVEQGGAGVEVELVGLAVDLEGDGDGALVRTRGIGGRGGAGGCRCGGDQRRCGGGEAGSAEVREEGASCDACGFGLFGFRRMLCHVAPSMRIQTFSDSGGIHASAAQASGGDAPSSLWLGVRCGAKERRNFCELWSYQL